MSPANNFPAILLPFLLAIRPTVLLAGMIAAAFFVSNNSDRLPVRED